MRRILSKQAAIGLLGLLLTTRLIAADQSAAEARLRETLKATMLQLRDAQTQLATLQSTSADLDQKNKDLTAQVEKLTKQLAADKDAADKSIEKLKTNLEARDTEIALLKDGIERLKASEKRAFELAGTKENQRAKLESEVIVLNRRVADQQMKNAAMFKLGNEILTRYEKFGLGDAITAREPFVGITRVKFQNLIQDYGDKLVDQQIPPVESSARKSKPAPPSTAPKKPETTAEKKTGQRS